MVDVSRDIEHLVAGAEGVYSVEDLKRKLERGRPLRVKLGMDPTAPDLHLGHCVVLRKLRQFQDLGHKAVLIIGDYTARVGDPTGRDITRPVLDEDTIKQNAATYLDQAGKVLDTSPDRLELRWNSQWLGKLSLVDVLHLTGSATVQQMLQRENFKLRMRKNTEIMVSELLYPLMQGYDSVAIEADVELGGTDQTFNNLTGRELMGKRGMDKQVVLVMPILPGLDGHEKMSKTKGNYVAVTDAPGEMFGKVMSIPDGLMRQYFTLLTDLPEEQVGELVDADATHPREAKDVLGRVIVEMFHGRDEANAASGEFTRRFRDNELPADIEVRSVAASPIGVLELIRCVGFAASNSEARRLVEQGGVSFSGEKINDPKAQVEIAGEPVLKVGKRRVCKVRVGS